MEDVKASGDLFERTERVNYAENAIAQMVRSGMLAPRLNALGHQTVGPKNKLMRAQSGIPVDLFTATEENWFNYLVCRTGPAALNQTIATAAQLRGWKWTPYGPGYQGPEGEIHRCASEEDVFHFIGMPYKAPNEREE
jgi:DNA polymerase/3'-5' exonuclease PolX